MLILWHDEQPINDEMTKWKGTISGPKGTPYEGGIFVIDIDLSDGYPMKPPKIKFDTKVWHPNVSWRTGAICLDILGDEWSPALSILKVLVTLQSVLAGPEVDLSCWLDRGFSDADAVVAQEYETDVEKWRQKAKSWTEQYAKPSWYNLNLPVGDGEKEREQRERERGSRATERVQIDMTNTITNIIPAGGSLTSVQDGGSFARPAGRDPGIPLTKPPAKKLKITLKKGRE